MRVSLSRGARRVALGLGVAGGLAWPVASEFRVARARQPLTERWRELPVAPRGDTLLGLSFRPRQAEALGLGARETLMALLPYPFALVRLGANWNRLEPGPGQFDPAEVDWQVAAAERAGKRIILCVGAVKGFGHPEFFVPAHHLPRPLAEGALVRPEDHRPLLDAACAFMARIVARYRDCPAIVAWQVEHEAVDPLGLEHSWRLSADFVRAEVATARAADPTRPILLNGFLPTSLPVRAQQWWRTRDQGDSLAVAHDLADLVGVDFYPRHALASLAGWSVYLDGGRNGARCPWRGRSVRALLARARARGQRVLISEGQAEPWETVTTPPDPRDGGMYSCLPERVIENYNQCLNAGGRGESGLLAYLFWGAEYWVLRQRGGDDRYLRAFARIVERA